MHILWKPGKILGPKGAVSTAKLQNAHARLNLATGKDPGKPAFLIYGIKAVQVDPGGDVGCILILVFQAFFHNGQVDQVQHAAPVHGVFLGNGLCRVL